MFEHTSRYYALDIGNYTAIDGSEIKYVRRRFLPQGESLSLFAEVIVTASDRLDIIADSTLGDAEQYWRICDANNVMDPACLLYPGLRLRIPMAQY
jgi:nucleoid-associated protein YgaU